MSIDEEDAKYLAKIAEKAIKEAGDTVPLQQLDESDYDKFTGVNLQGHSTVPPTVDEQTLALYMIDADQRISKRFKVTEALKELVSRGTARVIYGTTDPKGKQMKIIIQWERELRVGKDGKVT